MTGEVDLDRRLTNWTELGVVPAPLKHGLGRGRGTVSRWSLFASRQWQAQLANRTAGADIAYMCNLPVGYWVYANAGSPVRFPQVRRALHTWAVRRSQPKAGRLTTSAERTVYRVAHPGVTKRDRNALVKLLREAPHTAHPETEIPPAVRDVVARGPAGGPRRPGRKVAELLSAELVAQVLGVRIIVMAGRDGLGAETLDRARRLVREATAAQAADEAGAKGLASWLGESNPPIGLQRLPIACLDVAEAIGMLRLRELGILGPTAATPREEAP